MGFDGPSEVEPAGSADIFPFSLYPRSRKAARSKAASCAQVKRERTECPRSRRGCHTARSPTKSLFGTRAEQAILDHET